MNSIRPLLVVIADDLTGSLDAGVQFVKSGFETRVFMTLDAPPPETEIAVYDLETREALASQAKQRTRALVSRLQGLRLYKKIDSTMRGNIGYELRALLETTGAQAAVVAPAFPEGGRITLHGIHYVRGNPLALTAFREDPRWPMRESHLPTLLMQQAGMEIGLLDEEIVSQGAQAIMKALQNATARIIVADALSEQDLGHIANAVYHLGSCWIPCGSAGLAKAWTHLLRPTQASKPHHVRPQPGGVLFVCASRNPLTLSQMARLLATGISHFPLEALSSYDEESEVQRLTRALLAHLQGRQDAILEACSLPFQPGGGARIARILGRVVRAIADENRLGGLFLTGGDIAKTACSHLGANALEILQEVQPGVPGAALANGPFQGLPLVTKAGGLGDENAMLEARDLVASSAKIFSSYPIA